MLALIDWRIFMKKLTKDLNDIFKNCLKKLNYEYSGDNLIQQCNLLDKGDFQCNICLQLAQRYKKSVNNTHS